MIWIKCIFKVWFFALISNMAHGESYTFPFAMEISIKTKTGDSIREVIQNLYKSTHDGGIDSNLRHHADALIQLDDPSLNGISCTLNREYKGQFGEVLFEFLSDYGCGMELLDPVKPHGPSYTLIARRFDPSKKFTVITKMPTAWRNEIMRRVPLREIIVELGLRPEEFTTISATMDLNQLYLTGSSSAVLRLWNLAQIARHKAEQPGADLPATKPADKEPPKDPPSTPTSKDVPR